MSEGGRGDDTSGSPPGSWRFPPTPPPPAYPPPAYPPPAYPPPAYPPPAGGAPPSGRTEGLAIVALVLGITGLVLFFLGVAALLGLIFALVALRRIKREGTSGRGMAIAGLVCSAVGLAFFAGFLVMIITVGSDFFPGDEVAGDELVPGQCLHRAGGNRYREVSCDFRHDAEVFAVVDELQVPEGDTPGRRELSDAANAACEAHFAGYVGISYDDSELTIRAAVPTRAEWAAGKRRAACLAEKEDGSELFASVRNRRV